ncbi:hypothetical protein EDC96DRAFT_453909, partial [Choanephora cucurbitarum]
MHLPDWALSFQSQLRLCEDKIKAHDGRLEEVEHLAAENARLQSELTAIREALQTSQDLSAPSFAAVVKKAKPKRTKAPLPRQIAAASRQFTALPEDYVQGYQYVYLPSRHKDSYKNLRSKLTMLKVNNWRVLDIHFPAARVVALLVHNDYVSELTAVFAKAGVKPILDFDPLDPKHLDDPRVSSLSASDTADKARLVHQGRLLRALKYIRSPACNAVAADFCARGWITDE